MVNTMVNAVNKMAFHICFGLCAGVMILSPARSFPAEDLNPTEAWHFGLIRFLLMPCFILECSVYFSQCWGSSQELDLKGRHMSLALLAEYMCLMLTYSCMSSPENGIAHYNMRAVGPPRPVYFARWAGWTLAMPIYLLINNWPLSEGMEFADYFNRLWPMLLNTVGYTALTWVGTVTESPKAGWTCIVVAFLIFGAIQIEQFSFLRERQESLRQVEQHDNIVIGHDTRQNIVSYCCLVFAAYGVAYLLGNANFISNARLELVYSYCDLVLKVLTGSLFVTFRTWTEMKKCIHLVRTARLTRENMKLFIANASAPIMSLDNDGVVIEWNKHVARLTMIPSEHVLGKDLRSVLQDQCKSAFKQAFDTSVAGESSGVVELTLVSQEGKETQLLMNFVSQADQAQSQEQVLGVGQDITELLYEKAIHARKTKLTAVVSHELRSPLHGIAGLVGMWLEVEKDKKRLNQLKIVHGCATRLLDLVTNIMSMVQLENSKEKPTMTARQVNMAFLVDEAVTMSNAAIDKAGKPLLFPGVSLINAMPESLPAVMGESYQLSQVLYNLITNACKFTNQGSITISARHDVKAGMLLVSVADTGQGIREEWLSRIFNAFEQEDTKDARSFQGIGIGLSVALSIAKMHGGDVTVESTIGKGTTFTLVLPCLADVILRHEHMDASPQEKQDNTGLVDVQELLKASLAKESLLEARVQAAEAKLKALQEAPVHMEAKLSPEATARIHEEVKFLRLELKRKEEDIAKYAEKAVKWQTESLLQRDRAEAAEREFAFMHRDMREAAGMPN